MTTTARFARVGDSITFRTLSALSVAELRLLLEGVETGYGVLASLDYLEARSDELRTPQSSSIENDAVALRTFLTSGWADMSSARAAIEWEHYRFVLTAPWRHEEQFQWLVRSTVYADVPDAELRVGRIQMSSPGLISFTGLGEPLRQLRELIKDMWFRNRQEEQLGEVRVQLARHFLREARKSGAVRNGDAIDNAVLLLVHSVDKVTMLGRSGKLAEPRDDIDDIAQE